MSKTTTRYICNECAYESYKWLGRCPSCGAWNTLLEEKVEKVVRRKSANKIEFTPLNSITNEEVYRFSTGIGELDRVLGGGIVPGSLVLLGGDPGIGKSTILLQVSNNLASQNQKVLYISGEESLKQIRLRSIRLGINSENIFLSNEQNIDVLREYVEEIDPQLIVIDSIQTVYTENLNSIPGSVSQLRESTAKIMEIAKKMEKAVFLIGHVTKEGAIAGPKVLEHMVDVVVYFEGEKNFTFRLLRGIKNRFGSTDEIGLMEMTALGLVEILDPSYLFLSSRESEVSGVAIGASFEGSRPLLIEVQSLVTLSGPGYARRMASGIDQNRLSLIIAVLEKRKGYQFSTYDVYLKITGGVFLKDPSMDLAIAAAIVSSYSDISLPGDTLFIGEIGLSGQIRSIPNLAIRIKEAERLGFKKVMIPKITDRKVFDTSLEVVELATVEEFIDILLEG
ncbi:MAG TPA: DNA repair protein RadA [Syntrophomonadaceae bacterium]|nr:DNA repair protein RadA [Syntrophomonadaceae bacterium]